MQVCSPRSTGYYLRLVVASDMLVPRDRMTPKLPTITPQQFIDRWQDAGFGERQGAQSFFNDLCGLEVWPESHWPGFALREADVFKTYMAWWCM